MSQRTKPPFRADQVGSLLRQRAGQGGAHQAARRRDHAGAAQGGRGCGDREARRQAGIDRPAGGDRRRVPPLVVALRFPQQARRRRAGERGAGPAVQGHADQGRGPARARQDRLLAVASDDRALQVPEVGRQGGAEDDHSRRRRRCISAAAGRRSRSRSIPRWSRSSPISARPMPRRCARSARRAAPTCSSTRSTSPISATTRSARCCATAATIPTGCCTSMPTWSTPPAPAARPA